MKTVNMIVSILVLLGCYSAQGQDQKMYTTSSIEYLFSWSNASNNGKDLTGPVRFAPFFNFQNAVNKDFSEKFGLFLGLSISNVGFIYDGDEVTRKKIRTYNLGIPVGFKIGNMDGAYLFGGYAIEFPLNYKEKTFINEEKKKFNVWFSDRTRVQQYIMAGIQLPHGANIKFRYYFTDFYDKGYVASDGQGGTYKPYENFKGNAFVISIGAVLFKGREFAYK